MINVSESASSECVSFFLIINKIKKLFTFFIVYNEIDSIFQSYIIMNE